MDANLSLETSWYSKYQNMHRYRIRIKNILSSSMRRWSCKLNPLNGSIKERRKNKGQEITIKGIMESIKCKIGSSFQGWLPEKVIRSGDPDSICRRSAGLRRYGMTSFIAGGRSLTCKSDGGREQTDYLVGVHASVILPATPLTSRSGSFGWLSVDSQLQNRSWVLVRQWYGTELVLWWQVVLVVWLSNYVPVSSVGSHNVRMYFFYSAPLTFRFLAWKYLHYVRV